MKFQKLEKCLIGCVECCENILEVYDTKIGNLKQIIHLVGGELKEYSQDDNLNLIMKNVEILSKHSETHVNYKNELKDLLKQFKVSYYSRIY